MRCANYEKQKSILSHTDSTGTHICIPVSITSEDTTLNSYPLWESKLSENPIPNNFLR